MQLHRYVDTDDVDQADGDSESQTLDSDDSDREENSGE